MSIVTPAGSTPYPSCQREHYRWSVAVMTVPSRYESCSHLVLCHMSGLWADTKTTSCLLLLRLIAAGSCLAPRIARCGSGMPLLAICILCFVGTRTRCSLWQRLIFALLRLAARILCGSGPTGPFGAVSGCEVCSQRGMVASKAEKITVQYTILADFESSGLRKRNK